MEEGSSEQDHLWEFVSVDQYRPPSELMDVDRVKKGLRAFLRGFFKRNGEESSPLDPEEDLFALSGDRLERAVPKIDWSLAAGRLDERLRPWLDAAQPAKPVVFYVAPPYGGRRELLGAWAHECDAAVIREPTEDQILSADSRWFRSWPKRGHWLLPRLEKCFLRQAEGLDLVRELFAQVLSGSMGQGVIGCDGWAWQFLQHVWLGRPSFTISAQARDGEHMKELFSASIGNGEDSAPTFRQADNGAYILTDGDDDPKHRHAEVFWRRLAARSRGNAGVAAAYWRRLLRTLPDGDVEDQESDAQRLRRETVWVTPWEELDHPFVPREAGETARFVLHALLLHGGLRAERLAAALPSERAAITEALLFLREAELVAEEDGEWRVTAFGYPAVRDSLLASDYLCDPF